ncbi:MAG: bifunctional oligoribonuclease/PAP phosphatase NrnA [Victivallaceae bacterium]
MSDKFLSAAKFFSEHNNFVIISHVGPDGDATGSSFAMLTFLQDSGKCAKLLFPDNIQQRLRSFTDKIPIIHDIAEFPEVQSVIVLDCANPQRAACGDFKYLDANLPVLNIDHHIDNAIKTSDVTLVCPEAAATGEILYYLFRYTSQRISTICANFLLMAICDDTGGFRFGNTQPDTLRAAADLQELGADLMRLNQALFFNKPLNLIKFNADLVVNHLQIAADGRYAFLVITPEMVEQYQLQPGDTDEAIEQLRNIAGTEIVSVLQLKRGICKASLRSKNPRYPVGPVARKFHGGGHEMASGCSFEGADLIQAQALLSQAIIETLNS